MKYSEYIEKRDAIRAKSSALFAQQEPLRKEEQAFYEATERRWTTRDGRLEIHFVDGHVNVGLDGNVTWLQDLSIAQMLDIVVARRAIEMW